MPGRSAFVRLCGSVAGQGGPGFSLDDVLLEVDAIHLLVRAKTHLEPALQAPTGPPAVGVRDRAAERIVGIELDADRLHLMPACDAARWPGGVSVDVPLGVRMEEGVVPGHSLKNRAALKEAQQTVG